MLTDESVEQQPGDLHPLCAMLRQLRRAAGLSLHEFQDRHGIPAVVLGSYERGDRHPPLAKLDQIFAAYGYRLLAVPAEESAVRRPLDMAAELRAIADQLERRHGFPAVPAETAQRVDNLLPA